MELRPLCTWIDITDKVRFTYVLLRLEVARCPFIAATNEAFSSSTLSSSMSVQASQALHCPLLQKSHY